MVSLGVRPWQEKAPQRLHCDAYCGGRFYFFLFALLLAASACRFLSFAVFVFTCFCAACLCTAFGDLSPISFTFVVYCTDRRIESFPASDCSVSGLSGGVKRQTHCVRQRPTANENHEPEYFL